MQRYVKVLDVSRYMYVINFILQVNTIQVHIDGLIQGSEYMKVQKPTVWRTFLTKIEKYDQNTLTVRKVSRADIIAFLVQSWKKYKFLCLRYTLVHLYIIRFKKIVLKCRLA